MNKPKAIMNWSGGKDSALALHAVLQADKYNVVGLLTTVTEGDGRITMHHVREELLDQQAAAIGLPLVKVRIPTQASMTAYDSLMRHHLAPLAADGVTHAIFGDLFLADLKTYRQQRLAELNLTGVFPLWQQNTAELAQQFVAQGFRAITVCVNEKHLDQSFVGREMDAAFFASLPASVDPCGENGEYHSFVYDGPLFAHPIAVTPGGVERRVLGAANNTFDTAFWFADLHAVPEFA
ncbi:MAG: diphthine--ammonia ligase [Anaerolineaceae bacterium]|nr:diphthine--ammonia ligase [Anaerolineaceae bacterium]